MCKIVKILDSDTMKKRLNATANHDSAVGARQLRRWARFNGLSSRIPLDRLADLYAASK